MIHSFRITNYQSVRDTVELDFRVPGTTPEMPCFRKSHSRPGIRIPTSIVLIGPNGSGKTTLLRAITDTLGFVTDSFDDSPHAPGITAFKPFLSQSTSTEPTTIQMEFDALWPDGDPDCPPMLCRYTLVIKRDGAPASYPEYVGYEALHIFPKGRPRRLMVRRPEESVYVASELNVSGRDPRLSIVPPNVSAISTLGKTDVKFFTAVVNGVRNVQSNIAGADPWRLGTDAVIQLYRNNPHLVDEVSDRLRRFDLGIEKMSVIQAHPTGEWLLYFPHHGLIQPVPLIAESSGTRHLVQIFPQLDFVPRKGSLAIVDALDNDFHIALTMEILNWFRRYDTNPDDAQVICSLHNTSVLDSLEKEEVFIVEKNTEGATICYCAGDVEGLRRDSNLQKQYRGGVLGGLPRFG